MSKELTHPDASNIFQIFSKQKISPPFMVDVEKQKTTVN